MVYPGGVSGWYTLVLSLFYLGFGIGLPLRYPIFPFFPPRETEQSCAQRFNTFNTFRRFMPVMPPLLSIIPGFEPRASSLGDGYTTVCTAVLTMVGRMVVYPGW